MVNVVMMSVVMLYEIEIGKEKEIKEQERQQKKRDKRREKNDIEE